MNPAVAIFGLPDAAVGQRVPGMVRVCAKVLTIWWVRQCQLRVPAHQVTTESEKLSTLFVHSICAKYFETSLKTNAPLASYHKMSSYVVNQWTGELAFRYAIMRRGNKESGYTCMNSPCHKGSAYDCMYLVYSMSRALPLQVQGWQEQRSCQAYHKESLPSPLSA